MTAEVRLRAQPAPLLFSTVFGLLMAAAVAAPADGPALLAAATSAAATAVGLAWRPAATGAVLAAATALALSQPDVVHAALAGLSAAVYLAIRHAAGSGVLTTTPPMMLCALAFTAIAMPVGLWPVTLPWLPLIAPVAVGVAYLAVLRPFVDPLRWEIAPTRHL
ncbi:hypothetical protein [Mycolicibacterium goodii]|uniref:Integral membrane protein n=1 Tax=Mycolicibacterium goodii TaxID=134601 RepID=A0A0K0X950_MYCGD|nr:hypothetical protein AFA91_20735 [Mycolicibacterium goodii]